MYNIDARNIEMSLIKKPNLIYSLYRSCWIKRRRYAYGLGFLEKWIINKIIAVTINKSLIGLGANGPTSKKTSRARSLINNIVITDAIVYNGFFISTIYNI